MAKAPSPSLEKNVAYACTAAGYNCTSNSQCCSNSCGCNGICQSSSACRNLGATCCTRQSCCTGSGLTCSGGYCEKVNGQSCTSDSQCASNICSCGTCRSSRLVAAGGSCSANSSCCSGNCGCNGICQSSGLTCRSLGASCCTRQTCCTGMSCRPDTDTCEYNNGHSCSSDSQCYSGYCVNGTCRSSLLGYGDPGCGSSSDCSGSLICSRGICVETGLYTACPSNSNTGCGCCRTNYCYYSYCNHCGSANGYYQVCDTTVKSCVQSGTPLDYETFLCGTTGEGGGPLGGTGWWYGMYCSSGTCSGPCGSCSGGSSCGGSCTVPGVGTGTCRTSGCSGTYYSGYCGGGVDCRCCVSSAPPATASCDTVYSISGTVFYDENRNGVKDGSEAFYSGATVTYHQVYPSDYTCNGGSGRCNVSSRECTGGYVSGGCPSGLSCCSSGWPTGDHTATTNSSGYYNFSRYECSTTSVTLTTVPSGYSVTTSSSVTVSNLSGNQTVNFGVGPACTPTTCAALGHECGTASDGCGGTLNCGTCTGTDTCTANQCTCTPTTCAASGYECGTASDGCGGTLNCGTCSGTDICTANQCTCTPTTCAASGYECGTASDGCGGTLNCGTCTGTDTCTANQCTCTPLNCASEGYECGVVSDGCGDVVSCGTCGPSETCVSNQCIASYDPWIQSKDADVRVEPPGGFTNPLPGGGQCGSSSFPSSLGSLTGDGGTPGIYFLGENDYSFGAGLVSQDPYGWVVGGLDGDGYNSAIIKKTSYDFILSKARQGGLTPIDITNDTSSGSSINHCPGGLGNCDLDDNLNHGLYIANGSMNLNSSSTYTFKASQNYVILVNGDLTISNKILVPIGSTAVFVVKGNITVDNTVGESSVTSVNPDLEGIYLADGDFIIEGNNNCSAFGADLRLNLAGNIVAGSNGEGGQLINNRNLCDGNQTCPVFFVSSRPDFILNLPTLVRYTNYTWQEVAP